ncbi:hypothetical protein A0H81_11228 [Grifola frondosa]|uniref:Uncharacterized protein n=1 Tax=Grifola frondosa TaxID=5627 RepID=A0A1C7M152_GRIFR|nr:hypothetical protein A0H81_11228 [Grifola frondosa]
MQDDLTSQTSALFGLEIGYAIYIVTVTKPLAMLNILSLTKKPMHEVAICQACSMKSVGGSATTDYVASSLHQETCLVRRLICAKTLVSKHHMDFSSTSSNRRKPSEFWTD